MATSSWGVNAPEAVKLWSTKLFREALKKTMASRFIGESSNSLCQFLTDTRKGPGDRIRATLRMQLTGTGVQGDATLEGNEEALATYTDDIFIDQLRHAVRSGGKMSEQRIPFSVREEARAGLEDWWADVIDSSFFNQLGGISTGLSGTTRTGNQAAIAPDSDHIVISSKDNGVTIDTTEASLSDTTTFALKLADIDRAKVKAQTFTTGTTPIIRPIKVDGEDKYVLFVHPRQMLGLRTLNTTTVGNYVDLFKAAMQGGKFKDNPIMTGASFEYNGVVVYESTRVPLIPGQTNRYRAIFCGAQAGLFAVGQDNGPNKMTWVEELFDYENQLGVSAGMIYGLKKTVYNSKDFGTLVISSWAPAAG